MNFNVQRFSNDHHLYSDAEIVHGDKKYQATFGQFINESGAFIDYTMERRDTLTPEGEYDYSLYHSPINKSIVILLHDVPGFEFIEHHIANWPYELKGCTSHGLSIDIKTPALISSGKAFMSIIHTIFLKYSNPIFSFIGTDGKLIKGDILGKINYETFKP